MENLEKIIAKIIDEANDKAKFILEDAKKNSDEISSNAEAKLKNSVSKLEKEYELIEKSELDRVRSAVALKSRNIILEAKQEAMGFVFNKLSEMTMELPKESIKEYVLKTLSNRALKENEKLVLAKIYEGMDLGLSYELSDKIKTGFMIEKNGIYENYALESLINMKKDEIEVKIQEELFKS